MEEKIKPYLKYKNSEYDWIGNVPSHWEERYLFQCATEQSISNKNIHHQNLLSLSYGRIKRKDIKSNSGLLPATFDNYQVVNNGNIILRLTDLQNDHKSLRTGLVTETGIITSAYLCLNCSEDILPEFFQQLLHSYDVRKLFYGLGGGLRQSCGYKDLKKIRICLPSLHDQTQIADFLNYKVALINNFIKEKKREIILLKEQKQAEFNQAITRGVSPNAKMKDSGITWIGEIPKHWELKRLKHVAKINPSVQEEIKKYDLNDSVVFLAMENISVDGIINNTIKRSIKDVKSGYTSFAKNDVVIAKITPCFENGKGAFLSDLESDIGFGTTELIVLRPNEEILGLYLYYILRSDMILKIGADFMTGSAGQKRIPTNFIENFRIGIPTIQEQELIIDTLSTKSAQIEKAITAIKKEITLIQDYKISLISDVVTGKVDVRNVAVEKIEDVPEEEIEEVEETEELENSEE